ncbi:MAG: uroporphyrin-III methyltransferase [Flavobacteriaceae bacterium]|nr:MAG: uroporphyrin-III methyltransferase [Flavobacteriaceae bacterium]
MNTTAERVYVGRKYGDTENQTDRQETINTLLVQYYREGKKVVRIKSGDPYIYGRAGEEARYLKEKLTPFNVIPGISAALAAANSCNIPITERHKSNAVLICTAHTADYSFEQLQGIGAMLKAGNTLALYMGLKSLDKLIPILIEITGDSNIPINAISNVSRDNEILLTATLGTIEKEIKKVNLPMPVVFLIGVKPI